MNVIGINGYGCFVGSKGSATISYCACEDGVPEVIETQKFHNFTKLSEYIRGFFENPNIDEIRVVNAFGNDATKIAVIMSTLDFETKFKIKNFGYIYHDLYKHLVHMGIKEENKEGYGKSIDKESNQKVFMDILENWPRLVSGKYTKHTLLSQELVAFALAMTEK